MQPFRKERQNKPYKCAHCPKSFKSSNGLKYHLEKVHNDEEIEMEVCNENKMEGMKLCLTSLLRHFEARER